MERVLLYAQNARKQGELRLDEEKVGLPRRREEAGKVSSSVQRQGG